MATTAQIIPFPTSGKVANKKAGLLDPVSSLNTRQDINTAKTDLKKFLSTFSGLLTSELLKHTPASRIGQRQPEKSETPSNTTGNGLKPHPNLAILNGTAADLQATANATQSEAAEEAQKDPKNTPTPAPRPDMAPSSAPSNTTTPTLTKP